MSSSTASSNSKYLNSAGEIYDATYDVALIVRDGPHRMLCTGEVLDVPPADGDYWERDFVRKLASMDIKKEASEIE
jgi:hypothetical protein